MPKIQRVLLSVTDKSGLAEFGKRLASLGVELISTGGTARVLRGAGLEVRDVSEVTGFPEMLDGRVKTLHPKIAAGVLAVRSNPAHVKALEQHGIAAIDMVVVNLYAFEQTAARPDVSFGELIENIDIGGPALIRAAAKNFVDVAVVVHPADYASVGEELAANGGALSPQTCWSLAKKAFAVTAAYDRQIAATLPRWSVEGKQQASPDATPELLDIAAPKKQDLRYGENPHQAAALYVSGGAGVANAAQLQGKELSYNNLVDLDAAWDLIQEFDHPACAIIKHTNPCGCAEQSGLAEAYRMALECDPVSAFGSVISFNRELDAESAEEAAKLFVEAVIAPGYRQEALAILAKKKNLRLIEMRGGPAPPASVIKSISGGFLLQSADRMTLDPGALRVVSSRQPSETEMRALEFAWKVVKHVKSNAIVYARQGQTAGVGAGQMSRVDSARIGAQKAVLPLEGTVVGSDAFFPFPDGVEEIARHGVTAVIQPGGSVRDEEVIAAADRLGLAMVFTGLRHFRH